MREQSLLRNEGNGRDGGQRCDALIFDCDGVLIDSEIVVCRIVAEELTALGYPVDMRTVIHRFAGRPDREMRAEIEAEWGRPIPADFKEKVDARTVEAYATELEIIPGVMEALDQLRVPVCVASSSHPAKLRLGLETVGLYERLQPNVISATLVPRGKPDGDVFLFAAGWMRTATGRCVVVEDSIPGVQAARRAGMRVLGFEGGTHCEPGHGERLIAAGAELAFTDMRELPMLVEETMGMAAR